jgi:hypothetical protein
MTLPGRPLALFTCSIMLVTAVLAGAPKPLPKGKPTLKSATNAARRETRRAALVRRSGYSAVRTTIATNVNANTNLREEGRAGVTAISAPRNTSISGLRNPGTADAVTRYSVASIRGGSRPSLSAQGLQAQRARQLLRQRSSPESRNVQRAVVTDPSPRSRSYSAGGLHPEVAPYRNAFVGGPSLTSLPAGTRIYRYHGGAVGGSFWTTERFDSPTEAANRLGMPNVPTQRAEVVLEQPIFAWVGNAASYPGRVGGGQEIFIVKDVLKTLVTDRTRSVALSQ